jgi:dihydroorotate dehydrogenase electron transfer subunit
MGLRGYRVTANRRVGPYATITVEGEVTRSEPGQFYMVRGDWGADLLHALEPGDRLFALGPLGRPFPREIAAGPPPILVGGGVGVPPLVYLARTFREEGKRFSFIQGARAKEDLILLDELSALGVEPILTTEDGSAGEKGLVTAPLQRALDVGASAVYACGPEGMLRAVAGLCSGRVPSFLSLEARMGCGYGVCLGCVVTVMRDGRRAYERVCKEGPVFEGEVIEWA